MTVPAMDDPFERRGRIDVYHHWPDQPLQVVIIPIQFRATRAVVTINKEKPVPSQISVDFTNATATVEFLDDHGDVAQPPAGAQVNFTSDDLTVLTIAVDPNNPLQGDITPVAEGTANVGATINDATGNPINEPNGQPFTVTSASVQVVAGAAASAELTIQSPA